ERALPLAEVRALSYPKCNPTYAVPALEDGLMIYILGVLLPPLGLLLNGQPFSAILNLVLIVPCIILGLIFPALFVVPSLHAVVAIAMKREDRKHRELVNAIERHGPPPGWRPGFEPREADGTRRSRRGHGFFG